MTAKHISKTQRGAESLEFVVIFGFYMMLIMAVFEFGRALYTYNILTEVTRRGARMATVCPSNDPVVIQAALFNTITGSTTTSSLLPNLDAGDISIRYFNNDAGNPEFVEVSINNNFTFDYIIPFIAGATGNAVPAFRTTLHMESNGALPGVGQQCNF